MGRRWRYYFPLRMSCTVISHRESPRLDPITWDHKMLSMKVSMGSKVKKMALISGEMSTTMGNFYDSTYNLYIEDNMKFLFWNWMISHRHLGWVYLFWVRSPGRNFKIRKIKILTIFQNFKNQKLSVVNNSDLIRWPKSDMTTEYRCRSVSGNVRGGSLIFRILDLEKMNQNQTSRIPSGP